MFIGIVLSFWKASVGTHQLGMLLPTSWASITFHPFNISLDILLELEEYSHIWILFLYHSNTISGILHWID